MRKLIFTLLFTITLIATLTACGGKFTCNECDESFSGTSYYGMGGDETMCAECAKKYWVPLDYKNFKN